MIVNKSIKNIKISLLLFMSLFLIGCEENIKENTMENNIDKEEKTNEFNYLPPGTVVLRGEEELVPYLIFFNSIIVNGEKVDYKVAPLPTGSLGAGLDFINYFNSEEIQEILFLGPDLDSLEVLEEIPEKFLPIGSIVQVLIEENIEANGERFNVYTENLMIIGYNSWLEVGGEVFDYVTVQVPQFQDIININQEGFGGYILTNHKNIGKVLHIPNELDISRCYREELLQIELSGGEKTKFLPSESIDRVLDCSSNF